MREYFDDHIDDDIDYDQPIFIFDDDEADSPSARTDEVEDEPRLFHFDDMDEQPAPVKKSAPAPHFDFVDDAPPTAPRSAAPKAASFSQTDQPVMFGGDDYVPPVSPRERAGGAPSYDDDDLDAAPTYVPHFDDDDPIEEEDDNISFSFGKVDAPSEPREQEFVFMPFLDIPDEPEEDDGDSISISFSRVKAERREKEFIFMPFLNDPEEGADAEDSSSHSRFRSSKGTIIDEGLVLIPLEAEEEEPEPEAEPEAPIEEDSGISIVGGDIDARPAKKPAPSKKRPPQKGGGRAPAAKGKKNDPEQQFRQAMRNIDPEILAAVRNDPIQRAALEQAVRIALVQQAAQAAVEKTTGRPFFGGASSGSQQPQKKKKKPDDRGAAARPSTPYESTSRSRSGGRAASSINVQNSGMDIFSSAPAEFGVPVSDQLSQPTSFPSSAPSGASGMPVGNPNQSPSIQQDPVLAALETQQTRSPLQGRTTPIQPDSSQDPALAALSGSPVRDAVRAADAPAAESSAAREKAMLANSPAAIRAAMRSGASAASLQSTTNAVSANAIAAAAAQRENENEVEKRSGCLIWIIIAFIAFFIGLLAIAVWPAIRSELEYRSASELLATGSYVEAANAFTELGDYKDSSRMTSEAYYKLASGKLFENELEEALEYFAFVDPGYADTAELVAQCRYNLGKRYISEEQYAKAYDQLYLIPKYQDAGELAKYANYLAAEQFYAAENYEDARARYALFPDYLDSNEKWQSAQFLCAQSMYGGGDYTGAYQLYRELGDYNYSPYYAALSMTQAMLEGKTFSKDETEYAASVLLSYPNDEKAVAALSTHLYDKLMLNGSWVADNGGTLTLEYTDESSNKLILNLWVVGEYDNVFFSGGVILPSASADPASEVIFKIVSFDLGSGTMPNTVTIADPVTNAEYTLSRA